MDDSVSPSSVPADTGNTDLTASKRVLEAVLLAASEPVSASELRKVFDNELSSETMRKLLEDLRNDWRERGVELVNVASGWRFQTRQEFQKFVERLKPERAPRYSRAVLETLAIIAYRQPVTRGDIEAIRGVTVSAQILKTLEARGWIDEVGHKEVPGRPALFATTKALLDDLNLRSLGELPALDKLENIEARLALGDEASHTMVAAADDMAGHAIVEPARQAELEADSSPEKSPPYLHQESTTTH